MHVLPERSISRSSNSRIASVLLLLILVAYASARLLEILPTGIPRLDVVALDVLSALAFALVDGYRHFRRRSIAVFVGLCLVIGNVVENLSTRTGFPFGRYDFLSLMGPKLLHVPILLGCAYVGIAYVSWILGCIIVGTSPSASTRGRIFSVPLIATFIMVAWDLAQDPVWSTVLHGWTWRDGGSWFGVPLSNYLGWYFTVFTIYISFALYQRLNVAFDAPPNPVRDHAAILFYVLCALGNMGQVFAHSDSPVVQDPSGQAWRVADILGASALVSLFVMGAFALLAWLKLSGEAANPTD